LNLRKNQLEKELKNKQVIDSGVILSNCGSS